METSGYLWEESVFRKPSESNIYIDSMLTAKHSTFHVQNIISDDIFIIMCVFVYTLYIIIYIYFIFILYIICLILFDTVLFNIFI